jgi:hypothetical protein
MVKGVPLAYGGQVAQVLQMVLYAKVRPHAGAGAAPPLLPCLDNCCAPVGTARSAYKKINFTSPNETTNACSAGSTTAYIDPQPAAHAGAELLAAKIKLDRAIDLEERLDLGEKHVGFPSPGKRTAMVLPIE